MVQNQLFVILIAIYASDKMIIGFIYFKNRAHCFHAAK
ncbi:putative membrane protein [Klebsiella oxytoca]|nr:putative membrane protein [Klebsiella oxytoca]